MKPYNTMPNKDQFSHDPKFTILVKASKTKVEGLTIESVQEPEQGEASIVFITKANKKWKLHFSEFSFIFSATEKAA